MKTDGRTDGRNRVKTVQNWMEHWHFSALNLFRFFFFLLSTCQQCIKQANFAFRKIISIKFLWVVNGKKRGKKKFCYCTKKAVVKKVIVQTNMVYGWSIVDTLKSCKTNTHIMRSENFVRIFFFLFLLLISEKSLNYLCKKNKVFLFFIYSGAF